MRLTSKVPKSEIRSNEEASPEFKYCCPVCLQYLNKILVSSCCKNYICRFCIGQMSMRARSDHSYTIRCAYCTAHEFRLRDVEPTDPIKVYTDCQHKSVTLGFWQSGLIWETQFAHREINGLNQVKQVIFSLFSPHLESLSQEGTGLASHFAAGVSCAMCRGSDLQDLGRFIWNSLQCWMNLVDFELQRDFMAWNRSLEGPGFVDWLGQVSFEVKPYLPSIVHFTWQSRAGSHLSCYLKLDFWSFLATVCGSPRKDPSFKSRY